MDRSQSIVFICISRLDQHLLKV